MKRKKKPKRLSPGQKTVIALAEIYGTDCHLCGETMDMSLLFERDLEGRPHNPRRPTVDHIIPRSLGGNDTDELRLAHRDCNQMRGNKFIRERIPANGC